MFVKNIMWTSFLSASLTVAAQDSTVNPVIACDTLEYSISPVLLDDITVRASGVVRKPDGMVLHPDEEIIRTATDGIDMLRKMQLPRVSVNPLTNEINIVGGAPRCSRGGICRSGNGNRLYHLTCRFRRKRRRGCFRCFCVWPMGFD